MMPCPRPKLKNVLWKPLVLDHVLDGDHGQRRTRPEACRGNACRQSAPPGEPLQRVADAGPVDRACADAGDDLGNVVLGERAGIGIHDPADRTQDTAEENHDARTEFVDEPALDRHQPGLEQYEKRERDLDRGPVPTEFLLDVRHEKRPAVLQVGDHHHAGDADDELHPRIREYRSVLEILSGGSFHGFFLLICPAARAPRRSIAASRVASREFVSILHNVFGISEKVNYHGVASLGASALVARRRVCAVARRLAHAGAGDAQGESPRIEGGSGLDGLLQERT